MKIAFIVTEFPSISQTFVLNQITGMLDMGHDVEIFADGKHVGAGLHQDVIKYGLMERVTYLTPITSNVLKRILKGVKYLLYYFPSHPRPVLNSLNIIRFGRQAASFSLLLRIVPFLGKGPYDIIQCHFGPCGIRGLKCIRTGALKGKLVTAFHGFDLSTYLLKNNSRMYKQLFKYGDLCLPISRYWEKTLIELGCPPDKLVVHRMGVNIDDFELLDEVIGRNDNVRILSVGRLVEKKGIRYGIEAVSKIAESHPNVEYRIVGDGPLKLEFERLIKDSNMGNRIRLMGWLNKKQVAEIMINSDILIAPSVTGKDGDMEGIPVVLMEALALGLPCISTEHSGIPELIIDGETGLLAPERDSAALANHIVKLIENRELAENLRINGRNHVRAQYNINTLNQNLIALYNFLLTN
jgi:colanic acid/amylovoran biosynthesis glycosyltransferase